MSDGLLGILDQSEVIENLRRAVEILSELEVPYWLGHALQSLGTFHNIEGDYELARSRLAEARELLSECGDIFCWAGSTRGLVYAELLLGQVAGPARQLAEAAEVIPIVSMQDMHIPYTLDEMARVLTAGGHPDRAAMVLGKARSLELPEAWPGIDRSESHSRLRAPLVDQLGEAELERLAGEGAAIDTDEALHLFRVWLLEVADEAGVR